VLKATGRKTTFDLLSGFNAQARAALPQQKSLGELRRIARPLAYSLQVEVDHISPSDSTDMNDLRAITRVREFLRHANVETMQHCYAYVLEDLAVNQH
jgi:hypothetical protein